MEREALWQRMLDKNYFDWCRREQVKNLERLFFSGEVDEPPADYVKCRELLWQPLQTVETWKKIQEKRGCFPANNGALHHSEEREREWIYDSLNYLWCRDFQYAGLSIQSQLELSEFLGIENFLATREVVFIDCWLKEILAWLWLDSEDEWDASRFSDSKFAHSKGLFYQIFSTAPLTLQGKNFVLAGEKNGWHKNAPIGFNMQFKYFFQLINFYRAPKALDCDKAPRMEFLKGVREDLASGAAPQLLLDIWSVYKK